MRMKKDEKTHGHLAEQSDFEGQQRQRISFECSPEPFANDSAFIGAIEKY
jgi:hypothetical protein